MESHGFSRFLSVKLRLTRTVIVFALTDPAACVFLIAWKAIKAKPVAMFPCCDEEFRRLASSMQSVPCRVPHFSSLLSVGEGDGVGIC